MENSLINILKAYAMLFEPDIPLIPVQAAHYWMTLPLLPNDLNNDWNLWAEKYYQRTLLRMIVYYVTRTPTARLSVEDAIDIMCNAWAAYVRPPGSLVGPWLAHIICAPITQKSLDSIHQKSIKNSTDSQKQTLSLLFTGKKIYPKDPMIFIDPATQKIKVLERPINPELHFPLDHKLISHSISTMLVWEMTTQRLQMAIQSVLNECGDGNVDSYIQTAVRLLSNIITFKGTITAINRSNIPADRDMISQALFEVPSKFLLRQDNSPYRFCAPSSQFCLGLTGIPFGNNYSHIE